MHFQINRTYFRSSIMRILSLIVIFTAFSCSSGVTGEKDAVEEVSEVNGSEKIIVDSSASLLMERFGPPVGFKRQSADTTSFAFYLRHLPLKAVGSPVKYYNGNIKANQVHEAVVDLPIGTRDLHQCADAVMRLWAEYLWQEKRYTDIHFNFTNGFNCSYAKWMEGYRVKISGNNVSWIKSRAASNTYADLWDYLHMVWSYAGTLSLSKELKAVVDQPEIGDVFILGGSPGHAIIVVDKVVDNEGNYRLMFAQSYMPAQEIQILKSVSQEISPWYNLEAYEKVFTPEWTFEKNQLKRFPAE